MFEPEVFRKHMYCIEVLLDTVRTFRRPHKDLAPGELCPVPLRYAPDYCAKRRASTNHGTQL